MPNTAPKALGEFGFIRRYLAAEQPADPELLLGIGDDAAIVRPRPGQDFVREVGRGDIGKEVAAGQQHIAAET